MSPELILLRILLNYDLYNQYIQEVDLYSIKDKQRELYRLFNSLSDLFSVVQKTVTVEEFQVFFFTKQELKEKEKDTFNELFKQLGQLNISDQILSEVLANLKIRNAATKLGVAALELATGQKSRDDFNKDYEKFNNIYSSKEEPTNEITFVTDDLEQLYHETIRTVGLRWRLNSLNRSIGSLRKGDFGFIFARPETGKTTFLASEITYFSEQTRRPILWFNNEEQGNKVKIRCYQATLGLPLHELMFNRTENQKRYLELTNGNLRIFDEASIHRKKVEQICKQFEPSCIIFDQIDKIKGFEEDREDLKLGAIYQWARELAKTYCPVIGVSQADGSGEGVKWLTMSHVANAKTSKQAEGDWILGIGKTNDPDYEDMRYFNICKNKLSGDEDTLPEMRHGRFDCRIIPTIARYQDI